MSHLGREVLRRVLAGEGTAPEADRAEEHLVSCETCRAQAATLLDELRVARPELRGEDSLRLVFDLIDRERRRGVEDLAALAEWAELRRISSRRSQRDRVRMTKACHTIAFFNLLLRELKEAAAWEEAEFVASLAVLSCERMSQRQQVSEPSKNDLLAEVWTAVANSRRRAAEWGKAHQALTFAERYLKSGTGDPRLEASLLSIGASTLADEGHVREAVEALDRCGQIYQGLTEWPLLARTLIQKANILAGTEPVQGLSALDHALPFIPAGDPRLLLFAEMLRVECLIEVRKPVEALQVFRRSSHLLDETPQIRPRIRGRFTSARLLDALGFQQHAERLFDEVVARDIEHELYKDALLDLLYLYGRHVKTGEFEKAAGVCTRALTDASLAEITHDQIRDLWTQLLNAAQVHAISQDVLKDLRRYLNVHWKQPAAQPPVVRLR
ncbi:MAG TPA: hypothetical protein VEL74_00540 [Thermoanaerobaculia bacterium]|nr:hypothetical protein [Thermoanaerobaculia bacterium]